MNRTRRLLMVAIVATALTADRLVAAAPVLRPQVTETARRLAARLVISLRHTVPAARMREFRACEPAQPQRSSGPVTTESFVRHIEFSPFQFRLPPPLI